MRLLLCLASTFVFPQARPADIDDVRGLIESQYSRQELPWRETAGTYSRVELKLVTEDFGIAEATLTSIRIVDLIANTSQRVVRVVVRRVDGAWETVALN